MTAILVLFFGVVGAVNFAMARYATSTFGGVVVENSYVASQHFNRWLDEAGAEAALGWVINPTVRDDGRVELGFEGIPAGATVSAVARHPLGREADVEMVFDPIPDGAISHLPLPEGRWIVRFEVASASQRYRMEKDLMR